MKSLSILLEALDTYESHGSTATVVHHVIADSRKVSENDLFVAVKGTTVDGHTFIDQVMQQGCRTLVVEQLPETPNQDCTWIVVPDTARALGLLASANAGYPSQKFTLVGVTGTNGKTTVATLLYQLFQAMGYKTGLVSTVEHRIGRMVVPSTHTTPDPVQLNEIMADMAKAGCSYVFMEVSSHAVDQQRIAGLVFKGGVFTNITHDHLDYHKTFAAYIKAKKQFFDDLPKGAFALTNLDDKNGMVMVQNTPASIHTYSLRKMSDFRAKVLENSLLGLHLEINQQAMFAKMVGKFNAYNLLAVFGTAKLLDLETEDVLPVLSSLEGAKGRFQTLFDPTRQVTGIVDYAHTPDALENVLTTIENVQQGKGHVITIVGCGGDRDTTKRPIMAAVACKYSHTVILTSDNPRTEDPEQILNQMEVGVETEMKRKVLRITDRAQAIKTATHLANANDVILVAGKGHEPYQEINGVRHPFDDVLHLKNALDL